MKSISNIFRNFKFSNVRPNNIFNVSRKNLFKRTLINFGLCYFFYTIGSECLYKSKSENSMNCAKLKFWEKANEGIELNNLDKRAYALQHNANDPIEDRYSAVELKNFPGYFLSVLDGHGGHQLAEFANQRMYKYFDDFYKDLKEKNKSVAEDELVVNALLKTFEKVEKEFYEMAIDLYRKGEGRLATVGSCALVAVVSSNKIYSAQLGDSKAKLFRKNKEKETNYEVIKLTTTHNAEKKTEQAILHQEFKDKDIVVCKRPNNTVCYVKGRLQPTRSLGDFHLKYKEFNMYYEGKYKRPISNFGGPYIKSVPEIKITEISKDDEYIVMATDGLWDFLNSGEVANIIKSNSESKIQAIGNSLFSEIMRKAAKESGMTIDRLMAMPAGKKRNIHDDVTMIVFDLKH